MVKKRQEAKGGSSASDGNAEEEQKMDIKSLLKDIEFLRSPHMTWKEKKNLENRKVVSLGGKPQKKQRLPLSVARPIIKKQKEREEKMLQESALLRRFGGYLTGGGSRKAPERRRPEDRVLKSSVGNFRNGVLDVKDLLRDSNRSAPPAGDDRGRGGFGKGKKKNGGKKGHGKRKGGGKKRH